MGITDLTPYSPRLLLQWDDEAATARHRTIDGTLVFADVSGFTRLSERLARTRGKAGAEELTDIISALFGDLLTVAASRGGEMLKYGGDAVLLFFRGDGHATRAAAAAWDLQLRIREIGRVDTDAGAVRLRMSIGVASGGVDLFKVGRRHRELIVAGPVTTETVRVEAAAAAGEILLSAATAAALPDSSLGACRDGARLLRRRPEAQTVPIVPARPVADADTFVSETLRPYLALDVEPEHRLATVSFVHLMGLDHLLSGGAADEATERLDATLTVVQDALADLGVTFLATDLAGDGTKVMAVAGAPLAADDDERRMLLALRRMMDAGTPLDLRAGTHRGHVFAAAVGPPFRRTYTALGDVTNTAARVMGRAARGEVLALRSVVDAARGVRWSERPSFVAKGKAAPLTPFAVEAVVDDHGSASADLPLVGRDVELKCVLGALDGAVEGTGRVVEVVAEMGGGKSRLLREAAAARGAVPVYVVHCEPYERATPFHPVRRLLERLLDDPLSTVVEQRAPQLTPWLPLLAAVLDVEAAETPEAEALDPRFRLQRTAAVAVDLLRTLAPGPTVFVVEDVHWLDDASAAVLRAIERAAQATPWVLCVTRRDEESTFVPVPGSTELVHLAPLAVEDMHALVRAATSEMPLPPHRRDDIVARAAGNPLYLTELLTSGDGDGDAALPASVEAVVAAQIDRLEPSDRSLLRHAAVLGTRFGLDLLAAVTGDRSLAVTTPAQLAARFRSLLEPIDVDRVQFRHQLVRDVAYAALPFRQRRAIHAIAASVIEREIADPTELAGILSLHYLNARDDERCWHYARIAAQRACDKHASVEAVALLERALGAARRLDVPQAELAATWELLAQQQRNLGSVSGMRAAIRQARRLTADSPIDVARLCAKEARLCEWEARTTALYRWIRRGLQAIEGLDDDDAARAERAELLVLLAWAKTNQGRPVAAKRIAQEALRQAEAVSNRWAIAAASLALEGADVALGLPSDSARCERALEIYEELGLLYDQGLVLTNLGSYAYEQSRWLEALDLSARARDVLHRAGNLVDGSYGAYNMAEVLISQGRLEEASPILDEIEVLWRSIDHVLGLAYLDSLWGRVHLWRDELDLALARFRAASETFHREGMESFALDVDARAAECLLRQGDIEAACAALDEHVARDAALGGTRIRPLLLRLRGYGAFLRGDRADALDAMAEAVEVARTRADTYETALALEAISFVADDGEGDGGQLANAECGALLESLGVVRVPAPPLAARRLDRIRA